jgi:hypothetical protein
MWSRAFNTSNLPWISTAENIVDLIKTISVHVTYPWTVGWRTLHSDKSKLFQNPAAEITVLIGIPSKTFVTFCSLGFPFAHRL